MDAVEALLRRDEVRTREKFESSAIGNDLDNWALESQTGAAVKAKSEYSFISEFKSVVVDKLANEFFLAGVVL